METGKLAPVTVSTEQPILTAQAWFRYGPATGLCALNGAVVSWAQQYDNWYRHVKFPAEMRQRCSSGSVGAGNFRHRASQGITAADTVNRSCAARALLNRTPVRHDTRLKGYNAAPAFGLHKWSLFVDNTIPVSLLRQYVNDWTTSGIREVNRDINLPCAKEGFAGRKAIFASQHHCNMGKNDVLTWLSLKRRRCAAAFEGSYPLPVIGLCRQFDPL